MVAVAGSVVIFVLMHDSCMLSMAYWIHAIVSFQVDLNDWYFNISIISQ